ncbi:tyrosine recombinase XerS (plasmid) [Rossellomorea sp. AcN35-11]|nr:tyrosine recombinase XerS [Rossellomorea aquimaris]WJV31842.1 tyrosine recombinase XerS [Rossellomorea sp. AcN35-11]
MKKTAEQDRTYLFRHMKVFPGYIQDYFKSKLHSLSPSTLRGYAIDIEDFLEWILEEGISDVEEIKHISLNTLEELKVSQVQKDYVSYLDKREYRGGRKVKGKKLNHQTIHRKFAALRALFYWLTYVAKDEKMEPLLSHNVIEEVEVENVVYDPVVSASRIRRSILVGDEIEEYLNFIIKGYGELPNLKKLSRRRHQENKERDLAIISLMLETGITAAEVANLSMNDVDLDKGILHVSRKSGKSIGIDLTERASSDLQRYLNMRTEQYEPSENQYSLFLTNQQSPGQAITKRAIQNMIEKYSQAFDKPLLTAHKLRHSFGVRHYNKFKDLDKLQEILGYSDVQSARIYEFVLNEKWEYLDSEK